MSVPNRHCLTASATRRCRWPLAGVLGMCLVFAAQTCFAFGFEDVVKKASELSKQGYQAPESSLPESLSQLEYADYAQIQMKDDQALWQGEDLPFNLKFFHEGMHYNSAVTMHTIVLEVYRQY